MDEPPKIRKENGSDWGGGEREQELQAGLGMLTEYGHLKFFEHYLHHCYVNTPDSKFVREMVSAAARTPEAVACELIRDGFLTWITGRLPRRIDKEIPVLQVVPRGLENRAAGENGSMRISRMRGTRVIPAHLSFHEFCR